VGGPRRGCPSSIARSHHHLLPRHLVLFLFEIRFSLPLVFGQQRHEKISSLWLSCHHHHLHGQHSAALLGPSREYHQLLGRSARRKRPAPTAIATTWWAIIVVICGHSLFDIVTTTFLPATLEHIQHHYTSPAPTPAAACALLSHALGRCQVTTTPVVVAPQLPLDAHRACCSGIGLRLGQIRLITLSIHPSASRVAAGERVACLTIFFHRLNYRCHGYLTAIAPPPS
jgi:hypothetical protein